MTQWKKNNKNNKNNNRSEGFTIKEGLETSSPEESMSQEIADKLDQGGMYSSFSDPAENLRGEFDQMVDSIDTLTSGISSIYDEIPLGTSNMDVVWDSTKSSFFDIKGAINTVVAMIGQFSAMVSYFLQVIISLSLIHI